MRADADFHQDVTAAQSRPPPPVYGTTQSERAGCVQARLIGAIPGNQAVKKAWGVRMTGDQPSWTSSYEGSSLFRGEENLGDPAQDGESSPAGPGADLPVSPRRATNPAHRPALSRYALAAIGGVLLRPLSGRRAVQQRVNPSCQFLLREWLLEKRHVRIQPPVVDNGISGINRRRVLLRSEL